MMTFGELSVRQIQEAHKKLVQNLDVTALKAKGDHSRAEFLKAALLEPPQELRLIDCKSTCEEDQVVLIDWRDQQVGYTAISHTFGMEVYDVFDCLCTSKCFAKVPRCADKPCPQHPDGDPRNRVVRDILNMCAILRAAGVEYAWHDGVCIAQHNKAEVEETIKHMGWIYANARGTIIFLHYVGTPMAPINLHDIPDFQPRWHTRVWTLQEAAVSKHRRYCLRVGSTLADCQSLHEFEEKLALWYRDETSKVEVVDEDRYYKLLLELTDVLDRVCVSTSDAHPIADKVVLKAFEWSLCISQCMSTLIHTCFQFPDLVRALEVCSSRNSKHEGDRINSILTLAGVKDFVAPKDVNMEASTIEFFKRQGQQGLAMAVFAVNIVLTPEHMDGRRHTWVPILSASLRSVYQAASFTSYGFEARMKSCIEDFIGFAVLEDGKIELRGELACVAVKFTVRIMSERKVEDCMRNATCAGAVKRAGLAIDLSMDVNNFWSSISVVMDREELSSLAIDPLNGDCDGVVAVIPTGRVFVPRLTSSGLGPLVQGHGMNDGESFCAHLVLSPSALQQHRHSIPVDDTSLPDIVLQGHRSTSASPDDVSMQLSDFAFPALLVQGDLHAPVSKLGCFHLNKHLSAIITDLLPSLTIIHNLVIM